VGYRSEAPILFVAHVRRVVKIRVTGQIGEEGSEPDHEPFFEVERLKEHSLHQFEGRAKGRKDLNLRFGPVHGRHFTSFRMRVQA
jgi:hypothetical protein